MRQERRAKETDAEEIEAMAWCRKDRGSEGGEVGGGGEECWEGGEIRASQRPQFFGGCGCPARFFKNNLFLYENK